MHLPSYHIVRQTRHSDKKQDSGQFLLVVKTSRSFSSTLPQGAATPRAGWCPAEKAQRRLPLVMGFFLSSCHWFVLGLQGSHQSSHPLGWLCYVEASPLPAK